MEMETMHVIQRKGRESINIYHFVTRDDNKSRCGVPCS